MIKHAISNTHNRRRRMKMRQAYKTVALGSLFFVFALGTAHAEQKYSMDLTQYEIGDIPEELGSVVVTNGKKIKGKTVLIGFQKGPFHFQLPSPLSGNFEIKFTGYNLTNGNNVIRLHSSEKSLDWKLHWTNDVEITKGEKIRMAGYKVNKASNNFHIVAKGRAVKLFVNGEFIGSQLQNPSVAYDSFSVEMNRTENELTDISFIQK